MVRIEFYRCLTAPKNYDKEVKMIKENCIKILGLGLSHCENSFKNVQIDIYPSEKNGKSDSFAYTGEEFKPNSAEESNLKLRNKYQIQSFYASELSNHIRTRNYAYSHTVHVISITEYLLKVLELAIDVNNKLESIVKKTKSIKNSSKISKDDKEYQITKASVGIYIDILLEIKARIADLESSKYKNRIVRTNANLDTTVRGMLTTAYIPDEMAESFNNLYEMIPLNKFSEAKAKGLSKITTFELFKDFSLRLYSSAIKPFLSDLMEEFSYYVTPDTYLNNAKKKAILVVPISIYKKFNFSKSGLTREEVVFIESRSNMEKTVSNLSQFYSELSDAMNCMYNKALEQKNELFSTPEKHEVEWIIDAYMKKFASKKLGNIKSIKLMLKDDFFREKFTVLLYELRPDLLTEILTVGGDPWEIREEYTSEQYNLDYETVIYLYNLMKLAFGDKKFPSQNSHLTRFLKLLSYNSTPERSVSRILRNLSAGKVDWSNTEIGHKFRLALEK